MQIQCSTEYLRSLGERLRTLADGLDGIAKLIADAKMESALLHINTLANTHLPMAEESLDIWSGRVKAQIASHKKGEVSRAQADKERNAKNREKARKKK